MVEKRFGSAQNADIEDCYHKAINMKEKKKIENHPLIKNKDAVIDAFDCAFDKLKERDSK